MTVLRALPRRFLLLASLAAAAPAPASAGVTVTASLSTLPGDVAAGATVEVLCVAEGQPSNGMMGGSTTSIDSVAISVSGGSVAPAMLTEAISQPCATLAGKTCSVLQGSVAWTTPPTPGAFTATCTAAYTTTPAYGTPTSGILDSAPAVLTTVPGALPPSVSAVDGSGQVPVGASVRFGVTASDPNVPPQPLGYAWSATGGTIAPDPSDPAAASWQAPEEPGTYEVAVTVTAGARSSESRRAIAVVLARYQAALPAPVRAPRRLAAGPAGELYVVDGWQGSGGSVAFLTPRGELRGRAAIPAPALAVARGGSSLWVTTARGSVLELDAFTGRVLRELELRGGGLSRPGGIAYDPTRSTLWIADAGAGAVRIVRTDGTEVRTIRSAGGAPLVQPVDVAVDPEAGRAYVLVADAKKESTLDGEPLAASRFLHAFDLAGTYLGSWIPWGVERGQLSRGGGVAASGGRVYVSDVLQGTVQVVSSSGVAVGSIGEFGALEGQLTNPSGVAVLANGDLAIANASLGRVDRYGSGAPLQSCAGDEDCDGLPDAWEIFYALDPRWAGDALLDGGDDGLTNAEEYARGTDPRNGDTDGDGADDADEVGAGLDPLDAADHRPAVAGSGPTEAAPGLVKLLATVTAPAGCTPALRWAQAGGPPVALADPTGGSPSFIARAAGEYAFDAVATCGAQASAPARVRVHVRNVTPVADAGGGVLVSAPGAPVRLDAGFSSDANGGVLAFEWDQTLGRPELATEPGTALLLRPRGPGLYRFMLTVRDAEGAAGVAELPVLVAAGPVDTAVAVASPAEAEVGQAVSLDATASLVTEDAPAFSWEQVAGTPVTLTGAGEPVASFVPTAAGRYAFAVSVAGSNGRRSPPARVEVFVAEAGAALPEVQAASAATNVVPVNTAVALDASGSGTAFEWTQVAGPAAGLTYADTATAMAVPFSPGHYVFEVAATRGAARSRPARVSFEARAGNRGIPIARATAPGLAPVVNQLVFLDGRQSRGASRFRWSQLEGPWVALGAQAAVATFRPPAPGRYAFELVVDDGAVRSAPALVELDVAEGGAE